MQPSVFRGDIAYVTILLLIAEPLHNAGKSTTGGILNEESGFFIEKATANCFRSNAPLVPSNRSESYTSRTYS